MDWYEIMKPIFFAALSSLALVLGFYINKVGIKIVELLKAKLGDKTYEQAVEIANGLYIYLEDKYKDSILKMGETKKNEMEELLLEKFPSLTQVELDAINKKVWQSFNEGKETQDIKEV